MDWRDAFVEMARRAAGLRPTPPAPKATPLDTIVPGDVLSRAQQLVDRHAQTVTDDIYHRTKETKSAIEEVTKEIMAADGTIQRAVALAAVESIAKRRGWREAHTCILPKLLRREMEFDTEQLAWLIRRAAGAARGPLCRALGRDHAAGDTSL